MKMPFYILAVLSLMAVCAMPVKVFASDSKSTFTQAELDQMLAPIALYPDSLLSQIFMASTYPANVAEAVTWSEENPKQEGDAAVKAVQDKPWDPSVMSLVAFPQVLEMMGQNPDWVVDLGDAFLAEPDTVMDSVQNLRKKAKDEGNLKTTKEQKVTVEQQTIEQKVVIEEPAAPTTKEIIVIEPADPAVVYVPVYNPTVVYGTWWWPSYRPYYYYPPGYGFGSAIVAGIGFGIGVGITNSLWGGCNWGRGSVDIDVNRYNNININNNKLDINKKTSNWTHNSNNRSAPYRDKASQKKYNNKLAGADKRQEFRGREGSRDAGNSKTRDAERQRAQESLKKRGNDPAAARSKLSGAEGDKVRSQVSKIDREQSRNKPNSMDNKSRDRGKNLSSGDLGNKAKTHDRAKAADRASSSNLSQNRSKNSSASRSKNNSLSGINNPSRSTQNFNRGSQSRNSFSRGGGGGGFSRGGGGRR